MTRKRHSRSCERRGAELRTVAETSRDRTRDRQRFTHARERHPAKEGTSGRRIRLIFTERRGKRPRRPGSKASGESAGQEGRERRRCQRYGSIGSAGRNQAERQPEEARRSGSGVVETPGPPVSWSRVQARRPRARRKPRKDAGSTRGTGTRSRSSGKQKSVVRIVLVLRGAPQGRP
jgi:hypothetical protein